MKGPDARDWYSLPDDAIAYRTAVRDGALIGKRVALSPTLGYHEPAPAVRQAVERAGRVFAELGAAVEPADPFDASPMPIFETLALGGFWALLRSMSPAQVAVMDPALVEMCRRGEGVTQEEYVAAIGKRVALGQRLRQFFERYDALLSPTLPVAGVDAGVALPPALRERNVVTWVSYTYPFNLTGQPAASVPAGWTHAGLPVGLQIVARAYREDDLFALCAALETAHPWAHKLPPL